MKIVIPGTPVPQLRPRAVRMGKGIRMYDPKKVKDYKKYVASVAKQEWKQEPLESALTVSIDVYRDIQKSGSKKNKQMKEDKIILPTNKPDITNYVKGIEDALNGIVYADDSQIVELIARKFYSHEPRIEITVQEAKIST